MKRLARLLIGAVILMALAVMGIWIMSRTLGDRPTLYQGKASSQWVEDLKNQDPMVSTQASNVLTTQIIPQLTDRMFHDQEDSKLKIALIEKLNELPGVSIHFTTAWERRTLAATELGLMGAPARAAIPALLQALRGSDEVVRGPAADALGQIHSDPDTVIPALIACLADPEKEVCADAIGALGEYGSQAKAAVPQLINLLTAHGSKELWASVPKALKQIDPEAAAKAGVK